MRPEAEAQCERLQQLPGDRRRPGPTPGIARLLVLDGVLKGRAAVQCSPGALIEVLKGLGAGASRIVAVEKFVIRGRLNLDKRRTMDQVEMLERVYGNTVMFRPARAVKP